MRTLRHAVRMPIGLLASSWMVRIGAPLLMRTDPELALYGRYVVSKRLREIGFEFRFPVLADALHDLINSAPATNSGDFHSWKSSSILLSSKATSPVGH